MNIIIFGYEVLKREGLNEWKIKICKGDEGFCDKKQKTILIGKEAVEKNYYDLMLHEIAHCLTEAYHYSEEFENILKKLYISYLKGKIRKEALNRRNIILKEVNK